MACTTILVGKNASYDGSTMIARNDDSGSGHFTAKKYVVVHPEEQPKVYKSVLSHVEIELHEQGSATMEKSDLPCGDSSAGASAEDHCSAECIRRRRHLGSQWCQ